MHDQILQLSDMSQCFYIPRFDLFPHALVDNFYNDDDDTEDDGIIKDTKILEILILDMGSEFELRECYLIVCVLCQSNLTKRLEITVAILSCTRLSVTKLHPTGYLCDLLNFHIHIWLKSEAFRSRIRARAKSLMPRRAARCPRKDHNDRFYIHFQRLAEKIRKALQTE